MTAVPNTVGVIETAGGAFIDARTPDPALIDLDSIGTALANECRFGGHCWPRHSVATHAVLVARKLYDLTLDATTALIGLHHDDSEAFLKDVPKPLKPLFEPAYSALTALFDKAIVEALHLPFPPAAFHDDLVKRVDFWACAHEAYHLMPSRGGNWVNSEVDWPKDGPLDPDPGPELARGRWLYWHEWLTAEVASR